jgi:hypothetical protein
MFCFNLPTNHQECWYALYELTAPGKVVVFSSFILRFLQKRGRILMTFSYAKGNNHNYLTPAKTFWIDICVTIWKLDIQYNSHWINKSAKMTFSNNNIYFRICPVLQVITYLIFEVLNKAILCHTTSSDSWLS